MTPRARALLMGAPAAFLAVFFATPLVATLGEGISANAWAWLASPYVRGRLGIALLQATLSVLLAMGLALPLAWLHHRRALPWSRAALALHAAPFVLPVFVIVYGLQLTLGPVLAFVGPLGAVVLANAYYNYGFAARILHGALDRRPLRLEDAAATLGAPPREAFLRVTLPLLLPTFAAVALLVFLFSFASFGVVLLLGEGQVSTLETLLYQNLSGAFPRPERAAVLGLTQLALNVLLFLAYARLRRRVAGLARGPRPTASPPTPSTLVAGAAATLLGLLPLVVVLVGGFRLGGAWSLEPWRALLDADHPAHVAGFDLARALSRTLLYAASTALLGVGLALALAYGARGLSRRGRVAVDTLAALPLGTSGLLLGFGTLLAFGAGSVLDLRGAAAGIVAVHTLLAFPLVARIVVPALDLHDERLDEAAQTLGAPPRDVLARVHFPLLAPLLLAAGGLAAAVSLGDFGASLLLMRPDNMGLTVWIGRHDAPFDPMRKAQAVALTGLLLVLSVGVLLATTRSRPQEAAP